VIERIDKDGDGIVDEEDQCPTTAGLPELRGCPPVLDTDADGLADTQDTCPNDPEDFNGFQDEDGCPDAMVDSDGDGLPDFMDSCPREAGVQELNGCPLLLPPPPPPQPPPPEYRLIVIDREKKRIEIKQKVHYQTGKALILKDSYPLLDEVGKALRDAPEMELLIAGHTDNVGNPVANLKLSEARAMSVRDYLAGVGVSTDRLQTIGFGATRPMSSNATPRGREENRRVEFMITRQ